MTRVTQPRRHGAVQLALLLVLTAVVGAVLQPPVASAQVADDLALTDAPTGTEALAARLRARHRRDLPAAEELADATNGARLRWLAEHHSLALVRSRALLLLAVHQDAATRALVLRVLDSDAPVIVRAAALRATDGWRMDDGLARRMRRLAQHADPRLAQPAQKRLRQR